MLKENQVVSPKISNGVTVVFFYQKQIIVYNIIGIGWDGSRALKLVTWRIRLNSFKRKEGPFLPLFVCLNFLDYKGYNAFVDSIGRKVFQTHFGCFKSVCFRGDTRVEMIELTL